MYRLTPYFLGLMLSGLAIGSTVAYAIREERQLRNLHAVSEGVLYRSGQLPLSGLKHVLRDYDIKTIISLRDSYGTGAPPPDLAEEQYCQMMGIKYIRISPKPWWSSDGSVPAAEGVRTFLAAMDDSRNYPVLVHCFAGSHRTGALCAVYRMEYQHWNNARAIQEMKDYGYRNIDEEFDILGYLERYQPRWRAAAEQEPKSVRTSFYHSIHSKPRAAKKRKPIWSDAGY